MSDGMSDARAVGEIGDELSSAAYRLRKALETAKGGHRGMSVQILPTVNAELRGTSFRLVRVEEPRPTRIIEGP
jgi:hypothetical protein